MLRGLVISFQFFSKYYSILLLPSLMVYYIVSVLFLPSFWCPCMAISHEEVLYLQPLIQPKRFTAQKVWARSDLCVCVFSSHSFWTSSSLDVPAEVEGHTRFFIHLLSAVRALIFLARRIQPFLSLVDREVKFCVLTTLSIVLHPLGIFILFLSF